MVNVRPHGGDHVCETRSFGKAGYNITTLYKSVVILVNEERLNDDENFVNMWMSEVIEFVQDTVNDLHKQVALLILEGTLHEQGEDLVEERTSTKILSFVNDLEK